MEAYPLQWPIGKPRKKYPESARFNTSFIQARDSIMREIKLLGGKQPIISTNLPLRRDGLPLAVKSEPADAGVAVYFNYKNQQFCFACDRWKKITDNMQAINKTIEALRGIERWGSGDMVQQAFTGFAALEAPKERNCWRVLGLEPGSPSSAVLLAFKDRAKSCHPDSGGSVEAFAELVNAKEQALREAS